MFIEHSHAELSSSISNCYPLSVSLEDLSQALRDGSMRRIISKCVNEYKPGGEGFHAVFTVSTVID